MSLPETQLTAITQKYIVPKIFDNIFDSNPLLKRILNGGMYKSQNGGVTIDIPLNYAGATANGWFDGADTLDTTDTDNLTASKYSWKNVYAGVSITESEELKNGGTSGVIKLLSTKTQIALKTIKDTIGTGLYSDGTDAKSIVGLRDIVAADQTVGQISQATNSWWQAQVDSTTTTLSLSAMNSLYEDCSVDSEKPGCAFTTRTVYNLYYNLLTPQQRFMDDATAKGGFQNLMFNGIPIISDSHCPTSHLFFINEQNLMLYYHPERNFYFEPFKKPTNQQVKIGRYIWMGALTSSNNRLHGKFSGITA